MNTQPMNQPRTGRAAARGMRRFGGTALAAALGVALVTGLWLQASGQPAASQPATGTAAPTTGPDLAAATTQPTTRGDLAATTRPVLGEPITLNFRDASLRAVLEYLSQAAGMIIIESADTPITGKVTVMSRTPVNVDQAIDLLDSVLKEKGFAAIRQDRTLKIVTVDQARKEGGVPIQVGNDPSAMRATDRIITQIIPIQFVDATKLKLDIASLIPTTADVTSNAGSNTLIVTGTEAMIRRITEIVQAIDKHMAGVSQVKVFTLKYAGAANAAKLINDLFKGQQGNQQQLAFGPGGGRGGRGGGGPGGGGPVIMVGPGGPGAGTSGASAPGVPVVASADDRTNTLVVSAAPETLKVIEGILKEIDSDPQAGFSKVQVFMLKYATASSTAKLITDIFRPQVQAGPQQGQGGRGGQGGQPVFMMNNQSSAPATGGAPAVPVVASADDRTNTLVVSAGADTLKIIEEIVKQVDSDPTAGISKVEVFALKHAGATATATLINNVFKPQPIPGVQQNQPGRNQPVFMMSNQAIAPTGGASAQAIPVVASGDDRTNTLVISAAADTLKVIEEIVKEIDSNENMDHDFFIYHLKNTDAANICNVLNATFGATGTTNATSINSSSQTNRFNTSGTPTSSGGMGSSRGSGGSSGGLGGLGSGSTMGSSNTSNSTAGRPSTGSTTGASPNRTGTSGTGQGSTTPNSNDLVGQVYVVADTLTNSIVVTTATKNFPQVKAMIEDLDRAVPQVLIKVLIAEVTHEKDLDLGVEFTGMNSQAAVSAFGTGTGPTGFQTGTNFSNFIAQNTNGGFVFTLNQANVAAAIHAFASNNKTDVLSRPYILTSDNQQASIMVGQELPIITNSMVDATSPVTVTNSITYVDVGLILQVTPHINPAGLVTMDVYAETSQQDAKSVTLTSGTGTAGGASSPIIDRRYAQNRVAILDGQTIVIGGMMQDSLSDTVDKVPFLGDLPAPLGTLFQHTVKTKVKTELLIFLTPHVAQEPTVLPVMSKDEMGGMKIVPDAVSPGTFEEHMRGLQRGGATSQPDRPIEFSLPRGTIVPQEGPNSAPNAPAAPAAPAAPPSGLPQPLGLPESKGLQGKQNQPGQPGQPGQLVGSLMPPVVLRVGVRESANSGLTPDGPTLAGEFHDAKR